MKLNKEQKLDLIIDTLTDLVEEMEETYKCQIFFNIDKIKFN